MRRKWKRRMGIFLVVSMLAVLVWPAFTSIADDESEGFIIESGVLTAYTGSGGDITLPSSITVINDNVFSGNLAITSVTIPESVTTIGTGAFSGCTNLYAVSVPASVTTLGNSVFSGCSALASVTFNANVGAIPDMTFYGCSSLGGISIPGSVASIGAGAFQNCTLLGTITIPAAVSAIADSAFTGCTNLSAVNVDSGNANYSSYDGCVYNKTQTKLLYCPQGKYSVNLAGNAATLSYASMNGCYGISEVSLPESVKTVENNVFSGSGVQLLTIPKSVTSIGTQESWTPAMIYTYSNSAGEEFAIANNYTYELLDATTPSNGGEEQEDPADPTDPENPTDSNTGEEGQDKETNTGGTGSSGDSGTTGDTGSGSTGSATSGNATTGSATAGTTTGSALATNGVRSAAQLAGKDHVLDATPTTGPEENARVVLCLAVFFVGIYLIISSRKEEDAEQPA